MLRSLKRLGTDIREVSAAALRLSQGEFSGPLTQTSRDEVGELTRSFNLMTSQLQERLHMKEAMNLAMEVQQNLLPGAPPSVPGLDLAGRSIYCQETGGDYFDYILRPGLAGRRNLCVAVGDVVGHGISAALLMTTVRALLRCRLDQPEPMAAAVCEVNRLLHRDTAESGSFVTRIMIIAGDGAEHGQVEVGVRVYATWEDEFTFCLDDLVSLTVLVSLTGGDVYTDSSDLLPLDEDIRLESL